MFWWVATLSASWALATSTGVRVFEMANGLRVALESDPRSPLAGVVVAYDVGSADDPPERRGLSHLVEHVALRRTEHLGHLEMWDRVLGSGGYLNAYVSDDHTVYTTQAPADRLEEWLWIESERMGFLRPTPEDVAAEKRIVQREMVERDSLYTRMLNIQARTLYPRGSPYHATSDVSDHVARMTPEDVRWVLDGYYRPNRAALAVVSPHETERVEAWVRRYFEPLPAGRYRPPSRPPFETCASRPIHVTTSIRMRESFLRWYVPPSVPTEVLDVTRAYLQIGLHRYFEAEGLTARVNAGLTPLRTGHEFVVSVELPADEIGADLAAKIRAGLEAVGATKLTGARIDAVKKAARWAEQREWRSPLDRATWLAVAILTGRDVSDGREEVSADDVASVLAGILESNRVDLHVRYREGARSEDVEGETECRR